MVGIIAVKTKRTQIHFLSDILVAVALSDLKLPLRACLHDGGGPQVGEVTRVGGVTRLSIQSLILM